MSTREGKDIPGVVLWSLGDDTFRRLSQTGSDPIFLRRGPRARGEASRYALLDRPISLRASEKVSSPELQGFRDRKKSFARTSDSPDEGKGFFQRPERQYRGEKVFCPGH